MKISVLHIVTAHLKTLRNASTDKISIFDIFLFFIFPITVGITSIYIDIRIGKDFHSLSITFFGIFIALLLNIQVAIFGVFQRNWNKSGDEILNARQIEKLSQKRNLLKELNINVSYLIVVSAIYLVIYIVLFSLNMENEFSKSISTILYSHFILTLLMTVKRTHALFQGEYEID